jgi:hypothetical protein
MTGKEPRFREVASATGNRSACSFHPLGAARAGTIERIGLVLGAVGLLLRALDARDLLVYLVRLRVGLRQLHVAIGTQIKGIIELGARSIVSEPSAGTDMIAELAAKVVIKAALHEAAKKLARQQTEAITACEPSERTLDLFSPRAEQRRQGRPY